MKFDELVEKLLESTSLIRTMYHATPIHNTKDIVVRDEFMMSSSVNDNSDLKMKAYS